MKAVERRLSDGGVYWETVVVDEDAGGDGAALRMVGPYTLVFDDAAIVADGVRVLAEIPAGTIVLRCEPFVTTVWDSGDATSLQVGAGGPLAPPPDYDYSLLGSGYNLKVAGDSGTGYIGTPALSAGNPDAVLVSEDGYLVAETPGAYSGTPPSQGAVDIYVLIAA